MTLWRNPRGELVTENGATDRYVTPVRWDPIPAANW